MWSGLRQRMLPHDHKWFGVFGDITAMAWRKPQQPAQTTETPTTDPANPIATGSIPARDPAPAAKPAQ